MNASVIQQYSNGIQNEYINTNNYNFVNFKESMTDGEYEHVNMECIKSLDNNHWQDGYYWFKHYNDISNETCDLDTWRWELGEEKDSVYIKNVVLVINNPNNYKLNQIIHNIKIGGFDWFGKINYEIDLEMTINTISKILDINKPVEYKNGKIFVPLFVTDYIPYNCNSHNELNIYIGLVTPRIIDTLDMEFYCKKFYNKINNFEALYFPSEFTGSEILYKNIHTHNVRLNFNHPTYVLIIVGLDCSVVSNIKLLLDNEIVFDETPIQPNPGEPYIIWINRDFIKNLETNINFSRIDHGFIVINGKFEEDTPIDIISLRFNTMKYEQRMYHSTFGYV